MSVKPVPDPNYLTSAWTLDYTGSERLTMNMGPQHPSAHGVFRAILTLEGETVVGVDAVIGYLHRCHEKLAETLTYVQYPSIASKTDYVAAMTSELAYVMAAEEIGEVRGAEARAVPARARARAAAHRVALPVARHVVHGHGRRARRRRDDLSLLHPRARAGARSLRGARRRAAALRLPPGRRRALRHARRLGGAVPRDDRPHRAAHRRIRGDARGQRVLHDADARASASSRASWRRTSASRARCCAAPASNFDLRRDAAVFVVRGFRVHGAGRDRRRLLRALPRADGRVPRVDHDRPPDPRRPARGPDLVAARREVARAGAGAERRGLRARRRAARRSRLLPRRATAAPSRTA